jgi:UDP-glucose 4-epimerase
MSGVAVIGGAGFIGSHIVDRLISMGHNVVVFDNLSEGKLSNLDTAKTITKKLGIGSVQFVRGDIRDFRAVRCAVDGCSWVYHLAAMSRIQPSITEPLLAFEENVMGTANVAEACRQAGVKRLIYSASSSAYGLANEPPMVESMPTDVLNPYALSKHVGEEIVALYNRLYGLSTVSLRYFNVYGPRHQEEGSYATVIAIFRKQKRLGKKLTVVGDGTQRRDFTFVGDVVEANMLAAMRYDLVRETINVGTGVNYSINEVAEIVGGEVEFIPPRLGEARVTLACVDKAARLLGWKPTVSLRAGLEEIDRYELKDESRIQIVAG